MMRVASFVMLAVGCLSVPAAAANPCVNGGVPLVPNTVWTYRLLHAQGTNALSDVGQVRVQVISVDQSRHTARIQALVSSADSSVPIEDDVPCEADFSKLQRQILGGAAGQHPFFYLDDFTKKSSSKTFKTTIALDRGTTRAKNRNVDVQFETRLADTRTHMTKTAAGTFNTRTLRVLATATPRDKTYALTMTGRNRRATTLEVDTNVGVVTATNAFGRLELLSKPETSTKPLFDSAEIKMGLQGPTEKPELETESFQSNQAQYGFDGSGRCDNVDPAFDQRTADIVLCMLAWNAIPVAGIFIGDQLCRRINPGAAEWQPIVVGTTTRNVSVVGVASTDPAQSNEDFCMSHQDRDVDILLDASKSPLLELVSRENHGYFKIEGETMFLTPQSDSRNWTVNWRDSRSDLLPAKNDIVAAQGVFIGDCGHPTTDDVVWTEIHPPTVLAWIRTNQNGATLMIRAVGHATGSGGQLPDVTAALDQVLPFTIPPGKRAKIGTPIVDYFATDYDIRRDHTCFTGIASKPNGHLTNLKARGRQDDYFDLKSEIVPAGIHLVVRSKQTDSNRLPAVLGVHVPITLE